MAFTFGAKRRIVSRRPRTKFAAQVRPQMHGVSQRLVALAAQINAMNLAGLITDGRSARQTLKSLGVGKQRAVIANFGQQAWRDFITRAGQ